MNEMFKAMQKDIDDAKARHAAEPSEETAAAVKEAEETFNDSWDEFYD